MKITAIRTQLVNAKLRNWIFVRIATDQPGLHGLGEAVSNSRPRLSLAPSRILAS